MAKQFKNNIKILFVCHGNICRSPMAEFLLRDMAEKQGLKDLFFISSAATSTEEIGNPVHHGTRNKLMEIGVSISGKYAVQLKREDYKKYDYLIGMDRRNIADMQRMLGGDPEGKICRLMDFTGRPGDVADPWYTGDFDAACEDIREGCEALMEAVLREQNGGGSYVSKKGK